MSGLEAKRAAIVACLAAGPGFADGRSLSPDDEAVLARRVDAAIEGFDPEAPEPADPEAARLHRLLRAYRELRADEDDVRLAERGEVFATEDDA